MSDYFFGGGSGCIFLKCYYCIIWTQILHSCTKPTWRDYVLVGLYLTILIHQFLLILNTPLLTWMVFNNQVLWNLNWGFAVVAIFTLKVLTLAHTYFVVDSKWICFYLQERSQQEVRSPNAFTWFRAPWLPSHFHVVASKMWKGVRSPDSSLPQDSLVVCQVTVACSVTGRS